MVLHLNEIADTTENWYENLVKIRLGIYEFESDSYFKSGEKCLEILDKISFLLNLTDNSNKQKLSVKLKSTLKSSMIDSNFYINISLNQ